jgi:cold shock CspA family protein/TolA-binding protein
MPSVFTLPSSLVSAVESQNAVLFLGAASSFGAKHPSGARIPSGDGLRDLLCDQFLAGEEKGKPLTTVAELAINETDIVKVQQYIRELFLPFEPADFHLLIPRFRWHAIATTNYDLIVNRAYDPSNSPLQELVPFVKDGQHVETQMKQTVNGIQYLKLHGDINNYTDREIPLVLAREQYARYSAHRTRLYERFRDWGREFPIIFCGYSVADPHIQNILFDLFDLARERPMYYIVDPNVSPREDRYWASHRVTTVKATFETFMHALDASVPTIARTLPRSVGGGTSTLRSHYKVTNAPESVALFEFLRADVEHVRKGMAVSIINPKDFYRGAGEGWGGISQNLDVPRKVTDSLVIDAVLSNEAERSSKVDVYAVKGPAGNGKTIVLMRAAWMAANEYDKIVLFMRPGGTLRNEVIEEIFRYTQERIFLFVDKAALHVDEIQKLITFARARNILLTLIVAERDAEWNVRCEAALEKYGFRDFSVRYLSESEIRNLLVKLDEHDSLGLLKELASFEDRVQRLLGPAQRQLLVALHEATQGKAFEDIVFEEYQRIIPNEAQSLYLDICTLNRFGVAVRAGLIARTSGISFAEFGERLFKPLEHIVRSYFDKYIGDHVYTARHEHVAEMVFDRVLAEPEARFDQAVRIMGGMNLDFNSDRAAFSELIRGHGISEALRARPLGRAFYDAASKVAPHEAFVLQQRAVFEMEEGGDLSLAEKYLKEAHDLEPYNKSIQHSLAGLARRQAQATSDPLLRKRLRDRARSLLSGLVGQHAEASYGFHTAGQVALDELRDVLHSTSHTAADQMTERRIVELAGDFERFVQEGLQQFPLNGHLLALESEYRQLVHEHGQAEAALRKAFNANPRQDWVAIRLARTLDAAGKGQEALDILTKCLQENPTSRKAHYELAMLYIKQDGNSEFIFDHLRRAFTTGDQNFEAQFWFARQAFITGKTDEATDAFRALREANIPGNLRNEVRGPVTDAQGRSQVYLGEVVNIEDAYLFIKCPDFRDNIFVHRSRVSDENWRQLVRGTRVAFTLGFNMRGPTAISISPLI